MAHKIIQILMFFCLALAAMYTVIYINSIGIKKDSAQSDFTKTHEEVKNISLGKMIIETNSSHDLQKGDNRHVRSKCFIADAQFIKGTNEKPDTIIEDISRKIKDLGYEPSPRSSLSELTFNVAFSNRRTTIIVSVLTYDDLLNLEISKEFKTYYRVTLGYTYPSNLECILSGY